MDAGSTTIQGGRNGGSCCAGAQSLCQHPDTMAARYIYAVLFLIANGSAWWLRANPKPFYLRQRISGCNGDRDCLASEAVLIISMTLFLFHSFMFLTTAGTRNINDPRHHWHSQWWLAKIILLGVCLFISVVVPSPVIQLYGKVAHFGAGVFIFVQLISVIRYITRLNSKWCGQENFQNHKRKVNTVSKLAYVCSIVGIILMILFYVGCYANAVFIVTTVTLVYLIPIISLLTKANKGFYMEPALLGVYIVFLCWSAIKSEPETSGCYKKEETGSGANWITITSFVAELTSIAVAAFSTGTDYKCIRFGNIVEPGNAVPYGYGFFHFVFAMGSMYFGMLFVGWDTHHPSEEWSIDVGWTSTVVHLVNEGLAVISFVAIIIARRYRMGWLQQLLGEIFGIGGQQHADESGVMDPERSGTDNNEPPPESPATELEGTEMGANIGSAQEYRTTGREETETHNDGSPQGSSASQPVGTDREDVQQSSPSSMTGPSLDTLEPQAPRLGSTYGEIDEQW